MNTNNLSQLIEAIQKIAIIEDGKMKIGCKELFKLAEEYEIPYGLLGKICNQNNIKITQCQLGCF